MTVLFCAIEIDASLSVPLYIAIAYSMGQITRNSSADEIANVNFLYGDIVHALKMQ